MRKIQEPAWRIFAEERCEWFGNHRKSKGGSREEDSMRRDWLKACAKMGKEGTLHDWFYQMGWDELW